MKHLDPRTDGSEAPRLLAEINVTPFVDVMLVLLVVFMVVAPLMLAGVPLQLPATRAEPLTAADDPVVVSLDAEGRAFIGRDAVADAELSERLRILISDDPAQVVHVRADRSIDYGQVMDFIGRIGAAGVARISLIAEDRAPDGAAP